MAEKKSFANWFLELPWIAQVLITVLADCVLGAIRLLDGIMEGDIIKIVLGVVWLAYGLGIGWILDIVFIVMKKRPLFF